MIVNEIVNMIYNLRRACFSKNIRDFKCNVYIDRSSWYRMMKELQGQLNSAEFSVYESHGDRIAGHKIYRVDSEEPHLQVFEVK